MTEDSAKKNERVATTQEVAKGTVSTSQNYGELHYAVVRAKGKQYTVRSGSKITIDRINVPVGEEVALEDVLLIGDTSDESAPRIIGAPFVTGASVRATVVRHFRGKKVIIFKKRQRSRYTLKKGHRQEQTEILIERIAV
jgi:large subunit ribosomal protein L21